MVPAPHLPLLEKGDEPQRCEVAPLGPPHSHLPQKASVLTHDSRSPHVTPHSVTTLWSPPGCDMRAECPCHLKALGGWIPRDPVAGVEASRMVPRHTGQTLETSPSVRAQTTADYPDILFNTTFLNIYL